MKNEIVKTKKEKKDAEDEQEFPHSQECRSKKLQIHTKYEQKREAAQIEKNSVL